MTAAVQTRSAYPVSVDELLPKARELATELGDVPSRNRLKKELRVGGPKAAAVRDVLLRDVQDHRPAEDPSSLPEPAEVTGPEPAVPVAGPDPVPPAGPVAVPDVSEVVPQVAQVADPGTNTVPAGLPVRSWPVLLLALPAFVAIWSGWVGLGGLTGF